MRSSILLAAAMLVVAAVGALTLSHRQKLRPVLDQRATAEAAMEAYAERSGALASSHRCLG